MKSAFIFFALILLLAPSGMNRAVGTSKAGAQEEITEEDMTERWKHLTIRRDPFLDPGWLKKKQEEEQKRKEEESHGHLSSFMATLTLSCSSPIE